MRRGAFVVGMLGACLLSAVGPVSRAAESNLPYLAPKALKQVPYTAELTPGAAVKVTLKGNTYLVTSEFSLAPGWAKLEADSTTGFSSVKVSGNSATAETATFTLARKILKHEECIVVADTLTNKTGENLPLIVRNQVRIADYTGSRVAGRKIALKRAQASDPENPTTIAWNPNGSFGLVALDDVSRVHVLNYGINGVFGVADQNLALGPHASFTRRFAIFPSEEPDYYAQINAMRRFMNVNFQLDGPGAGITLNSAGDQTPWGHDEIPNVASSDDFLRNWILCKSAKYLGVGGLYHSPDGLWLCGPDGLPQLIAQQQALKDWVARLRRLAPGAKIRMYYHAWHYVWPDGKEKYGGTEVLNPDGTQATYGDPQKRIWLPLDGSAFARDCEKVMEFEVKTIGIDCFYWDEFEYSSTRWHYGEPWDGVSADIDPQTHQIARLKSSVTLLTQPWRMKRIAWLQEQGIAPITINGMPSTETSTKLRTFRHTETGSMSNCLLTHLSTPIALGDHITERTETDCYRCMLAALQYGCVYYWYHEQVEPITFKTLTEYMYPITPVELGEGYIIGKERILTAKSGWFSFGDKAAAQGHFFNPDGVEIKRELPSAEENGMAFFKVELAENESCALVRKEAK